MSIPKLVKGKSQDIWHLENEDNFDLGKSRITGFQPTSTLEMAPGPKTQLREAEENEMN